MVLEHCVPVKNLSLKRLLNKSKKLDSRRLAVLHESGSLHLLLVDKQRIVARKKTACDIAALNESVREFMNEQQLSDIAATIVLGLNSYQMLLVEAPPVEAEELAAALKWKVKDLLSQKVDQSIVDGFLLPDDAFRGRQKMAYAVATEKQAQQNLVDTLAEVGVLVDSIQVPELLLLQALKNVLSAGQAELVMVIGASGGMLVAIADGAVYLSRKLDVSADTVSEENSEQSQQVIDKLVLEMQRSRDYFESQMGKGIVGRLLLMPGVSAAMATQLNEQTGIKTQLLAASELYTQSASDLFLNAEDTLMAAALNAA
jgi:MSHA biogenesis protein MshI